MTVPPLLAQPLQQALPPLPNALLSGPPVKSY